MSKPECPVDLDDGLARAGDDLDFYKELIDMFLEDIPERLEELRQAAGAPDPTRLANLAHGIKGAAANLSANAARDAAFQIEMKGKSGDLDGVLPIILRLEDEVQRLAEFAATL